MRLFIAAAVKRFPALEELQNELLPTRGVKLVKTPEKHLTFIFIGEVNEEKLGEISSRIRKIVLMPFKLGVSGVSAFPNQMKARILYLRVLNSSEIDLNYSLISRALPEFVEDRRKFVPHITIARFRNPVNIADIATRFAGIAHSEQINRISLFKSTLLPNGPEYENLIDLNLESRLS